MAQATVSAFLAGRVSGIVLASGAFAALASFVELYEETATWADWARLGLGLALSPLGLRLWWARGGKAEPAWLPLNGTSPVRAMRWGLML